MPWGRVSRGSSTVLSPWHFLVRKQVPVAFTTSTLTNGCNGVTVHPYPHIVERDVANPVFHHFTGQVLVEEQQALVKPVLYRGYLLGIRRHTVGGEETRRTEIPWVVRLQYLLVFLQLSLLCLVEQCGITVEKQVDGIFVKDALAQRGIARLHGIAEGRVFEQPAPHRGSGVGLTTLIYP